MYIKNCYIFRNMEGLLKWWEDNQIEISSVVLADLTFGVMWVVVITLHQLSVSFYISIYSSQTMEPVETKLGRNVHMYYVWSYTKLMSFVLIGNSPQKQEIPTCQKKGVFVHKPFIFQPNMMICFFCVSLIKIFFM